MNWRPVLGVPPNPPCPPENGWMEYIPQASKGSARLMHILYALTCTCLRNQTEKLGASLPGNGKGAVALKEPFCVRTR